jgi:hypothetical protein
MSTVVEACVNAETEIVGVKVSAIEAVLRPFQKSSTQVTSSINFDYFKQALLALIERSDKLVHLAHKLYVEKESFFTKPKLEAASALLRRVTAVENIFINMGPAPGQSATGGFRPGAKV